MTQSINKLKFAIIQANIPERQSAKDAELFGKRAPKGGLLTLPQTLLLLEHYNLMTHAHKLFEAMMKPKNATHFDPSTAPGQCELSRITRCSQARSARLASNNRAQADREVRAAILLRIFECECCVCNDCEGVGLARRQTTCEHEQAHIARKVCCERQTSTKVDSHCAFSQAQEACQTLRRTHGRRHRQRRRQILQPAQATAACTTSCNAIGRVQIDSADAHVVDG